MHTFNVYGPYLLEVNGNVVGKEVCFVLLSCSQFCHQGLGQGLHIRLYLPFVEKYLAEVGVDFGKVCI